MMYFYFQINNNKLENNQKKTINISKYTIQNLKRSANLHINEDIIFFQSSFLGFHVKIYNACIHRKIC